MLKVISQYAKAADVGIAKMQFEINSKEIDDIWNCFVKTSCISKTSHENPEPLMSVL